MSKGNFEPGVVLSSSPARPRLKDFLGWRGGGDSDRGFFILFLLEKEKEKVKKESDRNKNPALCFAYHTQKQHLTLPPRGGCVPFVSEIINHPFYDRMEPSKEMNPVI